MNKNELFKHLNKHTNRGGIKWVEDYIDKKKVFTAYSREKELLIFNNKYILSFNPTSKEFLRSNFETKEEVTKITDYNDLSSIEGKELIKTLNQKIKRNINVSIE